MPPIDFAVSDKEMIATLERFEEPEEMVKSLLVSNEQAYINHFAFIFNELWKDAIDAKERILAIEQGMEPEFFEVINDHKKASKVLVDLAKSVKKEALLLLPNDKAMVRVDKIGVIDSLIKASQENNAAVKIICPLSKENSYVIKKISGNASHIRILDGNISPTGMFIVDNAKFFRAELREPKAEEFIQSIGFTMYSNSRRSVESFRSIFELLWNERVINEGLKKADKMQKEFIDIAAHELRNPIQPILGLSQIVGSKIKDAETRELQDIVIRNAKRLQQLTEDILDVTRIESQSLQLNKEQFNLCNMILDAAADFRNQIIKNQKEGNDNNNPIKLEVLTTEDIFVKADKNRLYQVISNFLSNAVKFTKEGTISVTAQKKEEGRQVFVIVRDTGIGIDAEILPRLFSKFATKSYQGSGLGLYVSKSIIEAHGGRTWAENNKDGKGATFTFSLPLSK
jgi:signal transduction histidine kinase